MGEGVQKPETFADVLYVWPLVAVDLPIGRRRRPEEAGVGLGVTVRQRHLK